MAFQTEFLLVRGEKSHVLHDYSKVQHCFRFMYDGQVDLVITALQFFGPKLETDEEAAYKINIEIKETFVGQEPRRPMAVYMTSTDFAAVGYFVLALMGI